MPSQLTDEAWLREQVAAHRTARDIAAELGVTDRAVRFANGRYGIERPPRHELVDGALAEYRAGTPLADIARKVHRGPSWIHKKVQAAGAQRPAGFPRRPPPRYPQLHDADWMRAQFDAGGSVRSIASTLGADRHTVRKAMVRHGLNRWPDQLVARYRAAAALEAEARRRQARVVVGLLARGSCVAEVARLLDITHRRRCGGCRVTNERSGDGSHELGVHASHRVRGHNVA